jgi:coenzyme Q-binding protein COQ10
MVTYTHQAILNYTAAQLFDLVADVERYPEFIPWMIATYVHRRTDRAIWTDLTVGMGPFRKRFSTIAILDRPDQIAINSRDPMFERFEQRWTFKPLADGGTHVEYFVDFKFRSFLLQALIDASFADRASAIISAYTRRARRLYGARL